MTGSWRDERSTRIEGNIETATRERQKRSDLGGEGEGRRRGVKEVSDTMVIFFCPLPSITTQSTPLPCASSESRVSKCQEGSTDAASSPTWFSQLNPYLAHTYLTLTGSNRPFTSPTRSDDAVVGHRNPSQFP